MLDFVLFVQVFVEFVDFVFVYNSDRGTVTNNSPSQDSNHPDDVFQSSNSMMMVIIVMVMVLIMLIMKITITMTITLVVIDEGNYYDTINNKDADVNNDDVNDDSSYNRCACICPLLRDVPFRK